MSFCWVCSCVCLTIGIVEHLFIILVVIATAVTKQHVMIHFYLLSKSRVHVRRTDKLISEAKFHPIEEYMQYVGEWYQQQQKQGKNVTQKRVYLATDDPTVLEEATTKYVL